MEVAKHGRAAVTICSTAFTTLGRAQAQMHHGEAEQQHGGNQDGPAHDDGGDGSARQQGVEQPSRATELPFREPGDGSEHRRRNLGLLDLWRVQDVERLLCGFAHGGLLVLQERDELRQVLGLVEDEPGGMKRR